MSASTLTPFPSCVRMAFVLATTIGGGLLLAADKAPTDANSAKTSFTAKDLNGATSMLPIADEAPAKIIVDPPVPELLVRGMALIQFRTENLRLYPAFGPEAAKVSPRIGHLHIRLDDTPWVWAHTSADDLIVNRLLPGPHKIQFELVNANHQVLANQVVQFEVPEGAHRATHPSEHEIIPDVTSKGQPAAKIKVDPPHPDRLAHGVAFLECRTENARIASVFGTTALEIAPRICHLHVTVDGARWRWADTSGGPVILGNLPPGPHQVLVELVNANHKPIASDTVEFDVPQSAHAHSGADASKGTKQAAN